jgi:hypothetical protein
MTASRDEIALPAGSKRWGFRGEEIKAKRWVRLVFYQKIGQRFFCIFHGFPRKKLGSMRLFSFCEGTVFHRLRGPPIALATVGTARELRVGI